MLSIPFAVTMDVNNHEGHNGQYCPSGQYGQHCKKPSQMDVAPKAISGIDGMGLKSPGGGMLRAHSVLIRSIRSIGQ